MGKPLLELEVSRRASLVVDSLTHSIKNTLRRLHWLIPLMLLSLTVLSGLCSLFPSAGVLCTEAHDSRSTDGYYRSGSESSDPVHVLTAFPDFLLLVAERAASAAMAEANTVFLLSPAIIFLVTNLIIVSLVILSWSSASAHPSPPPYSSPYDRTLCPAPPHSYSAYSPTAACEEGDVHACGSFFFSGYAPLPHGTMVGACSALEVSDADRYMRSSSDEYGSSIRAVKKQQAHEQLPPKPPPNVEMNAPPAVPLIPKRSDAQSPLGSPDDPAVRVGAPPPPSTSPDKSQAHNLTLAPPDAAEVTVRAPQAAPLSAAHNLNIPSPDATAVRAAVPASPKRPQSRSLASPHAPRASPPPLVQARSECRNIGVSPKAPPPPPPLPPPPSSAPRVLGIEPTPAIPSEASIKLTPSIPSEASIKPRLLVPSVPSIKPIPSVPNVPYIQPLRVPLAATSAATSRDVPASPCELRHPAAVPAHKATPPSLPLLQIPRPSIHTPSVSVPSSPSSSRTTSKPMMTRSASQKLSQQRHLQSPKHCAAPATASSPRQHHHNELQANGSKPKLAHHEFQGKPRVSPGTPLPRSLSSSSSSSSKVSAAQFPTSPRSLPSHTASAPGSMFSPVRRISTLLTRSKSDDRMAASSPRPSVGSLRRAESLNSSSAAPSHAPQRPVTILLSPTSSTSSIDSLSDDDANKCFSDYIAMRLARMRIESRE